MNDIVLQLVSEYTKNMMEYLYEYGISDIGKMAMAFRKFSDEHARNMLATALEEADRGLRDAKALRRDDGLSIHQRDVPRTVYTELGAVTIKRTYYKDKVSGEMIYLLDHIAGIEPYDRLCAEVAARIVEKCADISYGKSADIVTGGDFSRQTAKNKVMKTREVAYIPKRKEMTPTVLHIFADEDHVHMQNGKGNIVPLITISEGVAPVCKGRNELVDPIHLQGYKISSDDVWGYAYAVCDERYDMSKVEHIYIHGDGASWILKGLDVMPNSVHVLDHYHLKSKMRSLTAGSPEGYSHKLWRCIRHEDKDGFSGIVYEMLNVTEETYPKEIRKRQAKKIRKAGGYILAHWDAIMKRLDPDMTGSCTEPLISHVLSERFSRSPMGWSEAGLSKMVANRVYIKNGGKITKDDIAGNDVCRKKTAPRKIHEYEKLVLKQTRKFMQIKRDWSIFEKECSHLGKITGTKVAIDALGRMRNVG
jgi:hypothetical protein